MTQQTHESPPDGSGGVIQRLALLLPRLSVARPRAVVRAMLAVTGVAALGGIGLELRTDGHALVPTGAPEVRLDASVREAFHLRDPLIVSVETSHPDGVYNPATLAMLRTLSEELAALDGLEPGDVTSLATERSDRVYTGSFDFRPFLDPLPETPEQIEVLRGDVEAAGILDGTLLGHEGRAASVLVGVAPSFTDRRRLDFDRGAFYDRVVEVAARHRDAAHRIEVVGAPAAEVLLGRHILEDLAVLVPIAMLLVAAIVWIGCGRLWAVALALGEVGACLAFTFGLMGWLGSPIYLTTGVLPVVLTAMGVADELHVFRQYQRSLGAGGGPGGQRVLDAMSRVARPVVLTSLTTAIGLLSFTSSSIPAVQAFGAFAAVGIAFCMVWSLTVIPAALATIDPARLRHPLARGAGRRGLVARAVAPFARRPRGTLRVLGIVTGAVFVGALGLRVQDGWIDGFAADSAFRREVDRVNAGFYGTHQLVVQLVFEAEAPSARVHRLEGPLLVPRVWHAIRDFEAALREDPRVGGVLGAHSQVAAVTYLWLQARSGPRDTPDEPFEVYNALDSFKTARGDRRRQQVVHDDLDRALVTVFLKNANYRDTREVMRRAREASREHLAPLGGRIEFAGDVAVSQTMVPAVVRTQLLSLALALAGAWGVVALLMRSPRRATLAVAPAAAATLWLLGAMGWLGIPLGVATSTFCAITLGVGVDYAIHVLERHDQARAAGRDEPALAALDAAGPPILLDAAAIAGGFGLLALSQVPASARLGLLVAAALAVSCLLTLVGLGAALARDDVRSP